MTQVQGDAAPGISAALNDFAAAVSDDLNTAVALVTLDAIFLQPNVSPAVKMKAVAAVDSILGLNLLTLTRQDLRIRPKAAVITEAEIETALAARKEARAQKDFATSDRIRDDLIAKGVEVMDGDPLGWDWRLSL